MDLLKPQKASKRSTRIPSVGFPGAKRISTIFTLAAILTTGLFLNSCDESFNTFKENDRYLFSISGYLDSSLEEQWLRVINLQEEIDGEDHRMSGVVTMQHLETGEIYSFQDSLFQFSETNFAYNVRAGARIHPSSTYLLTATREDGAQSRVFVDIPDAFPDPIFMPSDHFWHPDMFRINQVEHLADVQVRFNVHHKLAEFTQPMQVSVLQEAFRIDEHTHGVYIYKEIIDNNIRGLTDVEITDCELYVASAGMDWIDFSEVDPEILMLPDGITNVENGTGYVIGVSSHTIPYDNPACDDQD